MAEQQGDMEAAESHGRIALIFNIIGIAFGSMIIFGFIAYAAIAISNFEQYTPNCDYADTC